MSKTEIFSPWQHTLTEQGLTDLKAWWDLPLTWVEPPNRAQGESGVGCWQLTTSQGDSQTIFVKRQQGFLSHMWPWIWQRRPKLWREYHMTKLLQRKGILVPTPIFFATGRQQAVWVTQALEGYQPLHEWLLQPLTYLQKKQLLQQVAIAVRQLHHAGIMHNCLYPKHVFIKKYHDEIAVAFLDLEKARWRIGRSKIRRDLETLYFHAHGISRSDCLRFLMAYRGVDKIAHAERQLLKYLSQFSFYKRGR